MIMRHRPPPLTSGTPAASSHVSYNRGVATKPQLVVNNAIPKHIQLAHAYLAERGSSVEEFEHAGNEVVANARCLDPVYPPEPALVFKFYHPVTHESLTFTDANGAARPFNRIKPLGIFGAKFLQPRGSGTHVYFANHPASDWTTVLADPSYGVVITEGETRSLAGAVHDLPVISITGVDCGQAKGKLHPDLELVDWRGRPAYLAFDSDVRHKAGPRAALSQMARLLHECGAEVYEVSIPPAPDGSKQGLDDYLARYGAEAFTALIASPETQPFEGCAKFEPPQPLAELMAATYPATEWAWDKFILKGEVNLLYGDGGIGKSLLALYLGVAVAAGRPLFGTATTQMPMLGLFAEDGPSQVQQRVTTILIELGLGAKGDLPVKLWCQPKEDTLLARIDDTGVVTELPRLAALRAELSENGRPTLIIIDSLADVFAFNESLRLPVNAALKRVLGGLCREFGATALVLAHPSKASMMDGTNYSGSTAFNNAVRQRLTLELAKRDAGVFTDGPPPRILSVAKSNYGPPAEKMLWYYGAIIAELQRGGPNSDGRAAVFHQLCIKGAIDAARLNLPCNRRHINEQVFKDAAKVLARRPSPKEALRELELGVTNGELIFVDQTSKRAAGFYPPDKNEAVALSLSTRRVGKTTSTGGNHA